MRLTHISNACCIYEAEGFRLIADPWLSDTAFEGSWVHEPGLKTRAEDLVGKIDAIYVSHLHPDHYDPVTLAEFDKSIPVVILDHGQNFLEKKLVKLGFTNVIKVTDKTTAKVGPFKLTLYAPFIKDHAYDDATVGNLIDSAIVVEHGAYRVVNCNDNQPNMEAAIMLYLNHYPTVMQLKYSLAGAYPSCFIDLTDEEKKAESKRLVNRLLDSMVEVWKLSKAKWFHPFAGAYKLGGTLSVKNEFLAVPSDEELKQALESKGVTRGLYLKEGARLHLDTDLVDYDPIVPQREPNDVRIEAYPYESDYSPTDEELSIAVDKAKWNLLKKQAQFNYWPSTKLRITCQDFACEFNLSRDSDQLKPDNFVEFQLDRRALYSVLTKKRHWNNLEVGCHIDMRRVPNVYDPDLSTMMSFFHE